MPWLLLIIFLGGLAAVSVLLPYWAARQYSRRYADVYDAFRNKDREFSRLKVEFERKNLEWLIGVRPVLYMDIDRLAQLCFARAYYVTTQGIELRNSLVDRLPYLSPSWKQIIAFRRNLKLIPRYRQALTDLNGFFNLVGELGGIHNELDDLPQQLTQKKKTTESQLSRLVPAVSKAENKLKRLESQYRSQVSDGIRWTVDAAKKALDSASSFITDPHQEADRAEDFSYASAHIFVVIAYNLLDMFWLFTESLIVPSRYQLDHFTEILDSVSEKLRQILILKPPQNWNSLYEAQTYLNSSIAKLKRARASLEDAHKKIKRVEALEVDLQKINLPGLLVEAKALQDECESYWGTMGDAPEYWQIALPDGVLPLERLESANRDYYQPLIAPKQKDTDGNQIHLKQTEIPNYLNAVDRFLEEVNTALLEMQALSAELSRHKEFQMEVLTRLNEEGDVFEAIRQLEEVKQYSSDEIIARSVDLGNRFYQYVQRAKKIRGANFPSFVSELEEFVMECRQVKDQHERIIFEYQGLAQAIYDQLQASYQEILTLKNEEPSLDWDWSLRIDELTRLLIPFILESRQYLQLKNFINSGEAVLQNSNLDQQRYQEEFSRCESAYQDVSLHLRNIQDEISRIEDEIVGGWAWRCVSLDDDLLRAARVVDQLRQEWEVAWQQAKIKDVLVKCDQIKIASDKILVDLDLRLQETQQIQKEFNDKYTIVDAAIQSPSKYRLDQYESGPELMELLVKLIRENTDPEIVAWALGEARRVVNQAKRDRLEQYTVFLLLTQIKSGQYKQSATYSINVGDISASGGVTIAGRDVKRPRESDDDDGI